MTSLGGKMPRPRNFILAPDGERRGGRSSRRERPRNRYQGQLPDSSDSCKRVARWGSRFLGSTEAIIPVARVGGGVKETGNGVKLWQRTGLPLCILSSGRFEGACLHRYITNVQSALQHGCHVARWEIVMLLDEHLPAYPMRYTHPKI
jgi:hypothetical protein